MRVMRGEVVRPAPAARTLSRWRFVLLGLVALGACADQGPETPLERLEANAALWSSTRPANYTFAVERRCFCLVTGPVRLTVEGETTVSHVFVDTGEPVSEDMVPWYPNVDGIFDILRSALADGAHQIDVTYDPNTGVPVDIWIDYQQNVADEELGFFVTEPVQPTS